MKRRGILADVLVSLFIVLASSTSVWASPGASGSLPAASATAAIEHVQKHERAIHVMAMLLVGFPSIAAHCATPKAVVRNFTLRVLFKMV